MKLRCCICKREVDVEMELAVFFECYVYCDKCLREMEEKSRSPVGRKATKESDL